MGEPLLVVLHLAEHRDDRHQQPGVLQHREGGGVAGVGIRGVVGQGGGDLGRDRAVVAGEAGVGDRTHPSILPGALPGSA